MAEREFEWGNGTVTSIGPEPFKSFAAEVIADNSGKFCGNNCYFATKEEAKSYAKDLMGRWTLVREWRVVESDKPVNFKFENGRNVML